MAGVSGAETADDGTHQDRPGLSGRGGGSLAVSARHLYEIVRALPEQQVTLKKAQNNYLVKALAAVTEK